MSDDFTQKEILIELMRETKAQSHVLSTLVEKTNSIEQQTLKTNGRVNKLEDRASTIENTQENLGVKVAAGVFVVSFIASTAFAYLFNKVL